MALGLTTYTSGSGSYALPPEANRVDVILLGGGGGGGGGDGGQNTTGEGGKKGTWQTVTLVRPDGGSWAVPNVDWVVGGSGSAGPIEKAGGPGGASTATFNGATTTAAGGAGGAGAYAGNGKDTPGESPGDIAYNGNSYAGGGSASANTDGSAPGGGGGPGTGGIFTIGTKPGRPGGAGRVWFYAWYAPIAWTANASLAVTAVVAARCSRGQSMGADVSVTASPTMTPTNNHKAMSALFVNTVLGGSAFRTTYGSADLAVSVSTDVDTTKTKILVGDLAVTMVPQVAVSLGQSFGAGLAVSAVLSAALSNGLSGSAVLPISAMFTAAAERSARVSADLAVMAFMSADARRTTHGSAALNVAVGLNPQATSGAVGDTNLTVSAALTAAAVVNRLASADFGVSAAFSASLAAVLAAAADLAVVASTWVQDGRPREIVDVPSASRLVAVLPDSRFAVVDEQSRITTVAFEDRGVVVDGIVYKVSVDAMSRFSTVAEDDRFIEVPEGLTGVSV
ncbi:Uncharacterised protein [Mycobacteroides abscessus subsp. abscessus]|nr:Uncharacterised protein [Mycobacteroides abscessus subsp. abscessus]SKY69239.1 Uncharacterised protein [Mycobacteroides abscessus subsp. abscessus]